jgi:hypothetical protein
MARGFFIFVVIMAGQLIVLGTPEATAVPPSLLKEMKSNPNLLDDHVHICLEHFFRLAGVASLLSFISGIDPRFFRNLVNRWESIGDRAGRQPKDSARKHPRRPRPGGGGVAAEIPVGSASVPRPLRPVQSLPPEPLETGQAAAN